VEQRHVILIHIPDVSTRPLRGAKAEIHGQADASDVLSYRQRKIFEDPATAVMATRSPVERLWGPKYPTKS
jgi:hypothetical protein